MQVLYCNSNLFLLQSLLIINLLYLKLIICNKLDNLKRYLLILCKAHCLNL